MTAAAPVDLSRMTVALTRPRERAERWRRALEEAGARVVSAPTIEILPPRDVGALDSALARLGRGEYDWVVYTSITGVERVFERLKLGGWSARSGGVRVAAVGRATADALRSEGARVDLVPVEENAEGLLAAFEAVGLSGSAVLMPRAAAGSETFPNGARRVGARVEVVEAYRSAPCARGVASLRDRLLAGDLDAVVFGSPSQVRAAVDGLAGVISPLAEPKLVCIGPTTAAETRRLGLDCVQAQSPDVESVIEALGGLR